MALTSNREQMYRRLLLEITSSIYIITIFRMDHVLWDTLKTQAFTNIVIYLFKSAQVYIFGKNKNGDFMLCEKGIQYEFDIALNNKVITTKSYNVQFLTFSLQVQKNEGSSVLLTPSNRSPKCRSILCNPFFSVFILVNKVCFHLIIKQSNLKHCACFVFIIFIRFIHSLYIVVNIVGNLLVYDNILQKLQ